MLRKHGVGMEITDLVAISSRLADAGNRDSHGSYSDEDAQQYFLRPTGPFRHRRFGVDERGEVAPQQGSVLGIDSQRSGSLIFQDVLAFAAVVAGAPT